MRAIKLLLCSLFLLLLYGLFFPRKEDKASYLSLLQESEGKKVEINSSPKQERKGVVKEIWFNDKYLVIEAPLSELYWVEKREAIEEMHGVKARVFEPMADKNLLRIFSSENGRFFYRNLTFFGSQVHFSSYTICGINACMEMPKSSPDSSGVADELLLQLKEEKVAIKAKKIKLNLEKEAGI